MLDAALGWLARTIHAYPRRIAVGCLAVSSLAVAAVARMPVATDLLDVMPARNPSIVAFTDFLRDFGVLDGLIVAVEAEEPAPEDLIAAVQSLGEELAASPYVASVDYNLVQSGSRLVAERFPLYLDAEAIRRLAIRLSPEGVRAQVRENRDRLLSPLGSPFDAELIRLDPLNIRELVRESLVDRLPKTNLDLSTGYYLDAAHRLAFLTVRPRGSAREMGFVRSLEREVSRVAAKTVGAGGARGLRVHLTGGYARAAEAIGVIWRDMLVSFAVSLALVLLILYLAFRPPPVVLIVIVLTLLAALSWTLLLARVLYDQLNVITSVVAAMLIGMFVDYVIHVYRGFRDCYRETRDSRTAVTRTLTGTGRAIVGGAITTALSFFSVVVTGFRGLHELGVVAGFGILFCLAASLILLPALLCWLAETRPACLLAGAAGDAGARRAAWLVERWPGAVLVAFAALLLVALVGTARTRFDMSLESVGLRESAVQAAEERMARALGRRGEPLFLVARAKDAGALAADFDALERQGERWRAEGRVGTFASPGMLLPPPYRQREALAGLAAGDLRAISGPQLAGRVRAEMDRQGLAPDASLEAYTAAIARALARREPVALEELARSQDPRAAYYFNAAARAMAAHLTPPEGIRWEPGLLAGLLADVRALGGQFQLVGPAVFLPEIKAAILWEAGAAVALSFAANLVVVWYLFGRWPRVALVMLPVTVGTLLTVGTMGILGLPFNFFNVAGIALVSGFGVDYGIYLVQAQLDRPASGGAGAVRAVGGSIVLCAVTTVASCGSLITSHYRGLASIGAVLCLGALFCLAATLLALPALLGSRRSVPS
jgi:predicted RND superfamily exporter protein